VELPHLDTPTGSWAKRVSTWSLDGIGIGERGAVLSVMKSSLDPPYFNSVGGDEDGPDLIFSYRGHWTDFPARFSVPVEAGREAVRRFVSGEFLPGNIRWEET
jgi:hypothetical protein